LTGAERRCEASTQGVALGRGALHCGRVFDRAELDAILKANEHGAVAGLR
jgi:hypothetical protein